MRDGSLVKEHSTATVYVVVGGAKLAVPSAAEFDACGYTWAAVKVLPDGALAALPTTPAVNTAVLERTRGWEMIYSRGRLSLPTEAALLAMTDRTDALTVPLGCLDQLPLVSIQPAGRTPSSMIFPPFKAPGWNPPTAKWFPRVDVPGVPLPNGANVVTLRGWIREPGSIDASDPDWHVNFEPDPNWLDTIGVDWSTIYTTGDILMNGINPLTPDDHHGFVATPTFHMEVNGFPLNGAGGDWTGAYANPVPPDWRIGNAETGLGGVIWPYLPLHDGGTAAGRELVDGDYVEISGSIVTDIPHALSGSTRWRTFWGHGLFHAVNDLMAAGSDWTAGHNEYNEDCPARYTEIHPPDAINLCQPAADHDRVDAVYGVALVARAAPMDFDTPTKSLTIALPGPPVRPAALTHHYRAVATEHVGPETNWGTITAGNADRSGAQLVEGRDAVTVSISVTGTANAAGRPGKFEAVYRVGWADDPDSYRLDVQTQPAADLIPYNTATNCTIVAVDNETSQPVNGEVLFNGQQIGTTNTPFIYTFIPTTTRVEIDPGDPGVGLHPRPPTYKLVKNPVPVTVHTGGPYPDVTVLIGRAPDL